MIIKVRAKPSSKKEEVEKTGEEYKVCVKERAEDNKANLAVIKLLGRYFSVPAGKIRIKSGKTSRRKIIEIEK